MAKGMLKRTPVDNGKSNWAARSGQPCVHCCSGSMDEETESRSIFGIVVAREAFSVAVELSKSIDDIKQMPLVELSWEILRAKKEPYYFRDLMNEIQVLRGMSQQEVTDVIARLYTEINIDGRFVCIGQNVWGLKRWYPVDKGTEKGLSGKRFVRRSGDAFSDDDEDLDDFEDISVEDDTEDDVLFSPVDDVEEDDASDDDAEDGLVIEEEDSLFTEDEEEAIDGEEEEAPLIEDDEDADDEDEED